MAVSWPFARFRPVGPAVSSPVRQGRVPENDGAREVRRTGSVRFCAGPSGLTTTVDAPSRPRRTGLFNRMHQFSPGDGPVQILPTGPSWRPCPAIGARLPIILRNTESHVGQIMPVLFVTAQYGIACWSDNACPFRPFRPDLHEAGRDSNRSAYQLQRSALEERHQTFRSLTSSCPSCSSWFPLLFLLG